MSLTKKRKVANTKVDKNKAYSLKEAATLVKEINCTKFDSSVDRNQPFEFLLGNGQVIKGWDEGVKGMKCGQKRQLIVPAELGYGSRKMPGIPANSTLVFDVQVLFIARGDPAKPAE